MGSSSSGQQPTQQQVTTTTSNLPEYARPYFEGLLNRAEAVSYMQPTTYPGERIAGFSPAQQEAQYNTLALGAPQQVPMGSALATQAGLGGLQAGQYAPGQFTVQNVAPQFTPSTISGPQLQNYQMRGPDSFTQRGAARSYMSPYIQNVLDVQRRQAVTGAKQAQLAGDLGAARQGTYGGSRQLLAGLERERQLGQQLNDIEATGMQQAYGSAQQQFNTEQQARQAQAQANLQALLGVQQLGAQTGLQAQQASEQSRQFGAGQSLQAQLANQQQGIEAQRLAEQSRQFGAGQGLQGLQLAGQMGQTLGNLGQYQQQMDLSRLQAQQGVAAQPQALQQQYLDQQYADYLRQRDFPMEQVGFYSNILRGLPVTPSSTTTAYAQPPSMMSQIAGAGLGAASIANLLR